MTPEEIMLWRHLRKKQVLGIKFLRQKILFGFIVDFYAPIIKFAIEVDGSQHYDATDIAKDRIRDKNLLTHGIYVLRYTNLDIKLRMVSMLEDIYVQVQARL